MRRGERQHYVQRITAQTMSFPTAAETPVEAHTQTCQNYKQLPPSLKKNGFAYTLVRRTERVCIYAQAVSEKVTAYEVFIPRIIKPTLLPSGYRSEACEVFPGNEDFGKTAWTCTTLEKANERFDQLQIRENHKS